MSCHSAKYCSKFFTARCQSCALVTAEITAMLPTPVAKISGKCETAIHEHFKIKESIDYQEDKFIETIEVDYENLDYEKSKVVMGTNFQDPKKVKISLKKSEETLIKAGYQEQK